MRSDTIKKGDARAPHRSPLRACGVGEDDFQKPFIAIVNSHVDIIPGHVHLNVVGQYVKARISEILSRETKSCDIVAQCDGHFLILLPETEAEQAAEVGKRIAARGKEELGLSVEVGVSPLASVKAMLSWPAVVVVSNVAMI